MPARRPKYGEHTGLQLSYTPVEPIVGGQLVEFRTGVDAVGVADADSTRVAGVAYQDIKATRETPDALIVDEEHALTVWSGVVIEVTYASAANAGDLLVAAANGQVAPAGAAPDADAIVGRCQRATATGAVGLARIF